MNEEEINLEILKQSLGILNRNIDLKVNAYRYNLEAGKPTGTFIPPAIDVGELLTLAKQLKQFTKGE